MKWTGLPSLIKPALLHVAWMQPWNTPYLQVKGSSPIFKSFQLLIFCLTLQFLGLSKYINAPDTYHLLCISRKFCTSCCSSILWSSSQPWKLCAVSGFFCRGGANALFHLRGASAEIIKEALSLMLCLKVILKIKQPLPPPNKALLPIQKMGRERAGSEFSPFRYHLNIRGTQFQNWQCFSWYNLSSLFY